MRKNKWSLLKISLDTKYFSCDFKTFSIQKNEANYFYGRSGSGKTCVIESLKNNAYDYRYKNYKFPFDLSVDISREQLIHLLKTYNSKAFMNQSGIEVYPVRDEFLLDEDFDEFLSLKKLETNVQNRVIDSYMKLKTKLVKYLETEYTILNALYKQTQNKFDKKIAFNSTVAKVREKIYEYRDVAFGVQELLRYQKSGIESLESNIKYLKNKNEDIVGSIEASINLYFYERDIYEANRNEFILKTLKLWKEKTTNITKTIRNQFAPKHYELNSIFNTFTTSEFKHFFLYPIHDINTLSLPASTLQFNEAANRLGLLRKNDGGLSSIYSLGEKKAIHFLMTEKDTKNNDGLTYYSDLFSNFDDDLQNKIRNIINGSSKTNIFEINKYQHINVEKLQYTKLFWKEDNLHNVIDLNRAFTDEKVNSKVPEYFWIDIGRSIINYVSSYIENKMIIITNCREHIKYDINKFAIIQIDDFNCMPQLFGYLNNLFPKGHNNIKVIVDNIMNEKDLKDLKHWYPKTITSNDASNLIKSYFSK